MRKRVLFVGPTGSGKSTLINILFNGDVKKESRLKPAKANDTSCGVTSIFTTYYDLPNYAYTDSIGFGDNRFHTAEIFHSLKCIIKQSMVGYNRIYLCLRYGRISNEIRSYVELLTTLFDKGIINYCTIVFTHCQDKSMTKQLYVEKNKDDKDMCHVINQVDNVIFGDNNAYDDDEIDRILLVERKKFLDQIKTDIDGSSKDYYIPRPTDMFEWISRIGHILMKFVKHSLLCMMVPITMIAITHGEIESLAKLFDDKNDVQYQDYYGECSICIDSMWSKNATITKCHHVFHLQCLQKLTKPVCPLCNETIVLCSEKN